MPDQMAAIARARARNQSSSTSSRATSRLPHPCQRQRQGAPGRVPRLASPVEKKVTQIQAPGAAHPTLQLGVTDCRQGAAPKRRQVAGRPGDQMQNRGELWMDMIATAFACGSRRVAVIQWGGASEGYDSGPTRARRTTTASATVRARGVAGSRSTCGTRTVSRTCWARSRRWACSTRPVMWVSEITEGHHQVNMVTVIAGGQALGLKMGQYIQYPMKGKEGEGATRSPSGRTPPTGVSAISGSPRSRPWVSSRRRSAIRSTAPVR